MALAAAGTLWAQTPPAVGNPSSDVNLAMVATASSSYVSGDTRVQALNDSVEPRSSRDARRGSYGNWPRTGTQWVQYEWSQPISTKRVAVYWWADGQGIGAPKACRLLYWNGTDFAPVANASGQGVALNQYNETTFDEVRTPKLKLEIDSDGPLSTGILEWKVYDSGHSPAFAPSVVAGVDRTVILGGKTWLNGKIKALKPDSSGTPVSWGKESGPGQVLFADAKAVETTATFSTPGSYVLRLTAGTPELCSSSTLKVKVENPPPAERLDVVYTKRYKLDSPLWDARARALIGNWIPHCIDQINNPQPPRRAGRYRQFC
jgi:hypothetical protein